MVYYSYREEKSNVLNRAHRAISTSEVFAHESLVELESVSMRRYGRSSIVHKNPVALAIGRFSESVMKKMKAMVGFRNIAVHDYQEINLQIVQMIVEKHLDDFREYAKQVLVQENKES
ncbi:DUF86 domain-containing protein [Geobacillus sp. NFOSA3]|uniref:DUF86 domain-containing protein n=1 Tax=Parageobacillus galactosidasius TaxID=883812 RepID=A0A226QL59_9BACL|nr:DUF86 domain-containing protein [Geobacillus sp. NFOSA3]OXB92320.1 hypothetical protein B9L23_14070 [Parageobacillus galactosidasius]